MNEYKIKVNLERGLIINPDIHLVQNDYNSTTFNFEFDDDSYEKYTKIFQLQYPDGSIWEKEIKDNKVTLANFDEEGNPVSILTQAHKYYFDIAVYDNDSKLTTTEKVYFNVREEITGEDIELDDRLPVLDDLINTVNKNLNETDNLDIDIEDTTITIIKKDGSKKTTNLPPGPKGDKGADGKNGINGTDGQDGYSPIAKVETTSTGATITITDKNGTTATTITNGKDGSKGDKGDPGPQGIAGKDGASVTHSWDGTTLTVTSASGSSSVDLKGEKGEMFGNSVKNFGAIGDGVTDDTVAIQTALDAGGVVYFPAGVYKVTKQLTTTKPCKIMMYKQYPSRFWRSPSTSGRYDYPIIIKDGESNYIDEKGWDFGARIECYPSTVEGEKYGLLIGDGCEVDGLFMRAMGDFSGVLLKYEDNHQYGIDNVGSAITYTSYPSSTRLKHIRLDCDRHNIKNTADANNIIPESMFDFYPKDNYFHILEDVLIGQQNEFATYGFRCVVKTDVENDIEWANSVRITNLCLNGLFDYPFYIDGSYPLTNWIFEGLTIQTYPYDYKQYEPTREGHKAIITLKNIRECLFSGCYIWDLYQSKYIKLFDVENLTDVSCIGCSREFDFGASYNGTEESGIETVLKGKLKEVAEDVNIKNLTMSLTTAENGGNTITLKDTHNNERSVNIPPVTLSDEQVATGINNWMDDNAMPTEQLGKNKVNVTSVENINSNLYDGFKPSGNTNMVTFHYIPVKKGDVIRWDATNTIGTETKAYAIYRYDVDQNCIGGINEGNAQARSYTVEDENIAYIRLCFALQTIGVTNFADLPNSDLCVTINNTDTSYEPYGIELVGGLGQYFMLQSPNGTRYTLSVTDDGTIVGEPITT